VIPVFFIGIFGIQEAQKQIGIYNNTICPSCGSMTHYEITKMYSYLHIFFIPAFRWNNRFYVKTACCNSIYELDPIIGQQFDKGQTPEIRNEHLRPAGHQYAYRICTNCKSRVDPEYSFCPFCGSRL